MKNLILLVLLITISNLANAVCTSPISRTNFSPLTVLTSTKLNADLNTLYTQVNELPGDCLTDETVTSAKIKDGEIVNADIANSTITNSKLASLNYTLSASSGDISISSGTYTDVNNLSASITTSGRPIEISLVSNSGEGCRVAVSTTGVFASVDFRLVRDAATVSDHAFYLSTINDEDVGGSIPGTAIRHIDFSGAGTYVFKLQAKGSGGIYKCKLLAREL